MIIIRLRNESDNDSYNIFKEVLYPNLFFQIEKNVPNNRKSKGNYYYYCFIPKSIIIVENYHIFFNNIDDLGDIYDEDLKQFVLENYRKIS